MANGAAMTPLNLRVDEETRRALERVMEDEEFKTVSDAARLLIRQQLRRRGLLKRRGSSNGNADGH